MAIVNVIPRSPVDLQFHQVDLVLVVVKTGDGGDRGLDRLVVAIAVGADARRVMRAECRRGDGRWRVVKAGARPSEVGDLARSEDRTRLPLAERTIALLRNLDGTTIRNVLLVIRYRGETLGGAAFGVAAINGSHVPFVIIRVAAPRTVSRESRGRHGLLSSHDLGGRWRLQHPTRVVLGCRTADNGRVEVIDRRHDRHAVLADGSVLPALGGKVGRGTPDLLAPERLIRTLEALPIPVTELLADAALVSLVDRAVVRVLRGFIRRGRCRVSQSNGVEVIDAFDAMKAALPIRRAGAQLDLLTPSLVGAEWERLLERTRLFSDLLLLEAISLALSTSGLLLPLAAVTVGSTGSASHVVEDSRLHAAPEPHDGRQRRDLEAEWGKWWEGMVEMVGNESWS